MLSHIEKALQGHNEGFTGRFSGHPAESDLAVPETPETLAIQQQELLEGKRNVMVFKEGNSPLPLLKGFQRALIGHDTYDFNPKVYTREAVTKLMQEDRIGEALRLGPVTKTEAIHRQLAGEAPRAVVERTPDGTEVRSAFGTVGTVPGQLEYFRRTQDPKNTVQVENPAEVYVSRLEGL
jgi:hypothetical protein